MTEPGRGEWLRRIRQRLQHGVPPLTHDECVRLYEIATGDTIEKRRRCQTCEGEGQVQPSRGGFPWSPHYWPKCPECGGRGYKVYDR